MQKPTAVLDIEVTAPRWPSFPPGRYGDAFVVLRWHGKPVMSVRVPVLDGEIDRAALRREVIDRAPSFVPPLIRSVIGHPDALHDLRLADRLDEPRWSNSSAIHPVTVAVCTRNRLDDLTRCLDGLLQIDYPYLDLLVIDNDSERADTERLLRERYPTIRYVRETRPGLDWARNRAVLECRGEILAFTDDDVIVDRQWVRSIVQAFDADSAVMAVTGLVIPDELETDAQRLFEAYGGFGRGFVRRWFRAPAGRPIARLHGGSGKFGTGANMAFRRSLFDQIGGFDCALDVGTCTNGGGDLDMFFRVLKAGCTLVYEPAAIVRHRHRRSYSELRTQIANNGVGFYAYLRRTYHVWPDERREVVKLGAWWLRWWHLRRLARSFAGRERVPRDLMWAELSGVPIGLRRYPRAAALAARISASHASQQELPPRHVAAPGRARRAETIRTIDLVESLAPISDAVDYERLRVVVFWKRRVVGTVSIDHHGAIVNVEWLADAIAQHLSPQLLDLLTPYGARIEISGLAAALADRLAAPGAGRRASALSTDIGVSVVVATRDRPADLRRCLASLTAQSTLRPVEIIVVDNNPESGLTSPVANEFPGVKMVTERRPGLSYARNRGIAVATLPIVATTDDDVTCPVEWIEQLVQPFSAANVMVVTGNVLPAGLDDESERIFEAYGGLGKGYQPIVADDDFFSRGRRAVATWKLGCTANAAFRRAIFANPAIGLMDEALGAGTPAGCSEDTYAFYRVLKAGYTIVYQPSCIVWHHHRQTVSALRHQIFSYAKGHVAYQLTTWLNDGDRRALVRLGYELPLTYIRRAVARVKRQSDYPLSFIALEVAGSLAGPIALWRSRRRVRRLGKSAPPPGAPSTYVVHMESPGAEVTKA